MNEFYIDLHHSTIVPTTFDSLYDLAIFFEIKRFVYFPILYQT